MLSQRVSATAAPLAILLNSFRFLGAAPSGVLPPLPERAPGGERRGAETGRLFDRAIGGKIMGTLETGRLFDRAPAGEIVGTCETLVVPNTGRPVGAAVLEVGGGAILSNDSAFIRDLVAVLEVGGGAILSDDSAFFRDLVGGGAIIGDDSVFSIDVFGCTETGSAAGGVSASFSSR